MKSVLVVFFLTSFITAQSQSKVQGRVESKDGEAIPGANIFIRDTYDGTSSNEQGFFEFITEEVGTKTLIIKFLGYKTLQQQIDLTSKDMQLKVTLQEEINELEAVSITAGAFTASDASRRTVFRALDIATTAGATADIAGALNTLPGTQKVGESGRLFIRGGDGYETKTFIDGQVVLEAYNPSAPNTPSRGRFLPFMFKGTSFSTGGYSSEYGQALSSVLALESKDESEITRTDIGILSVGGDVAHTQAWEGGSIAGKFQYTNIRPYTNLIDQEVDWKSAPTSAEGVMAFRQAIGGTGMVKVYSNFNNANFSLYNHDVDDYSMNYLYDLTNNYRYINASYRDILNKNWAVRTGASYTYNRNEVIIQTSGINETEKGVHTKVVVEGSLSDKIEVKTGAEVIQRNYAQQFSSISDNEMLLSFDEVISAAFVETDMYTSNKFVTRAGARIEHNDLTDLISVDPRFSLAYKVSKNGQLSFALGRFRQTPKNEFVRINSKLESEKAEHFILNFQHVVNERTFRVETYYKRYNDLVKFPSTDLSQLSNQGRGFAKGLEFFWRDNKSIRNLDYWVSYSYLDTKRDYLDFPYEVTPAFASKNNFSLVGKYFIQNIKSQIGITYSYTSGRPYNNPNLLKYNASRTPSYQDLSVNWSYLPKPSLIIHFSCTNVLGRDNIFSYTYSKNQNENGVYNSRAIRQAAPRFLFAGVFITLSKEKSMNQLPNL